MTETPSSADKRRAVPRSGSPPHRILHTAAGLHLGGVGKLLLRNLREMGRDQFSSHVCILLPKWDLESEFREAGFDVHYVPARRLALGIPAVVSLIKLIRELQIEVVHANHDIDHVYGGVAAAVAGIPLIRTIHHIAGPGTEASGTASAPSRLWTSLHRGAVRFAYRHLTTHFVAASEAVKDTHVHFNRLQRSDITVVHPGVPEPSLPDRIESARPVILNELGLKGAYPVLVNVGRLHPVKDQSCLIAMMKEIVAKWPKARLLIVGAGSLRDSLYNDIQRLKVAEYVRLLGQRDDVERLLAAADIMLSASRKEGFGISLVEGMHAGIPIVAVENGASAEIIVQGETGTMVPPGSSRQIAEAVLQLLEDPDEMRRMGERGRIRARDLFGTERSVQSLQKVYRIVLEDAGVTRMPFPESGGD